MKTTLTLILAATFTLLFSPTLRGALLRLFFYRDFPEDPHGFEPKYVIGGRIVTREEFDEWTERYAQIGAVPA